MLFFLESTWNILICFREICFVVFCFNFFFTEYNWLYDLNFINRVCHSSFPRKIAMWLELSVFEVDVDSKCGIVSRRTTPHGWVH